MKGVLREFSGCFKEVSRVFHENFMDEVVSRMFFLKVFHDFQGCFQSVSRKFQDKLALSCAKLRPASQLSLSLLVHSELCKSEVNRGK